MQSVRTWVQFLPGERFLILNFLLILLTIQYVKMLVDLRPPYSLGHVMC